MESIGEADVYATYVLLSATKVKVGEAAEVDGNVHSNDSIELKKSSKVRGDVSAVKEIRNGGGTVSGRSISHAPAVTLPAMPDKNTERARADRVLTGPVKLTAPVIDDVLYVNGAVTLQGEARGRGRLIATGVVTVSPPASGTPPPPSPGSRLSVVAYADVILEKKAALRATVRAKGRVLMGETAVFDGALAADRDVELARGARARFASPGDTTAPALTILAPADPFVSLEPAVELTVLYADAVPGVEIGSFVLRMNGATVTDRCSVGASVAFCSLGLATSGRQEVVASIADRAGNAASATQAFTAIVDAAAPSISIESPVSGALVASSEVVVTGTVSDDGVIDGVTLGGVAILAAGGRFAGSVMLAEGSNFVRVAARDSVGRSSETTIEVVRDGAPPAITMREPESLSVPAPSGEPFVVSTTQSSILIAGAAEDENGVTKVEVAGVPVSFAAGDFEREVALDEGVNRIHVTAFDRAGNIGALEIEVDRRTVPVLTILDPIDGAILLEERTIAVRGTVNVPGSIVAVNGFPAVVTGTQFVFDELPLADGATLINVVATSPAGFESSAGVTVLRDVDAPIVSIHEPADGSTVYQSSIVVAGMVNDVVVGTVNGAQVSVAVNGVAAEVSNRSFLLERVPLAEGDNTIEVTAVDPSGNVGRDAVSVRRVVTRAPVLTAVSGDRQVGVIGETLLKPLVVGLRDARGVPLPGQAVSFLADGTDGIFGDGKRQTAVTTDFAGRASVVLTLGRRAGHHTVRAMATGVDGEVVFVARALPAEPEVLVVDSGDQQVGATGLPLRDRFAAVVTDGGFNRLAGAVVRFEVIEGGGVLDGGDGLESEQRLDLVSDTDGRVTARLTLGLEEGAGNNVVRAWLVDGPPEAEVTFTASAMVADDPAATAVSGVVLDNSDVPVPGATVSIEGTTLSTRTDAAGYFRIDGSPVGTTHLRVRGATVERPGVWPSLEFLITIVAGRDNSMGRPLYLPVLDPRNVLAVDEHTGGTLTMTDVPGFALELEPGSVTFPGGARSGQITVTAVHSDKVPMPPNFGQQPRFVITIQPGGAKFEPPARVTFPNVDGLLPGQVTELYSFDHDLARFVSIGPGTVTGDGTRIVSDRGVGIAKAGWHGGGDPARPGTCHNCGECKSASGGACVADNTKTPRQKAPDDCKTEVCVRGRSVSEPSTTEEARQINGNCFEERCDEPKKILDLGDAPAPRECCGNPDVNAPVGVLTGIFDPELECCVGDGRFLVGKGPPIAVDLDLCPGRTDVADVPVHYDGCSGDTPANVYLTATGLFSGARNDPTPGDAGDPDNTDGRFSDFGAIPDPPVRPCDTHDACYQRCSSDADAKQRCDDAFFQDMNAVCGSLQGVITISDSSEADGTSEVSRASVCMTFSGVYYLGVQALGGGPFENGQRAHCRCC